MSKEQDLVIPLVEERVSATKRRVETGRVRVTTYVDEREQMVSAELEREEVEIERVPRGIELTHMPEVRLDGDVTIIPIVEEILVVEKKLVLVEEIRLVRRRTSRDHAQPVTVRAQRAEIERETKSGEALTKEKNQ